MEASRKHNVNGTPSPPPRTTASAMPARRSGRWVLSAEGSGGRSERATARALEGGSTLAACFPPCRSRCAAASSKWTEPSDT